MLWYDYCLESCYGNTLFTKPRARNIHIGANNLQIVALNPLMRERFKDCKIQSQDRYFKEKFQKKSGGGTIHVHFRNPSEDLKFTSHCCLTAKKVNIF